MQKDITMIDAVDNAVEYLEEHCGLTGAPGKGRGSVLLDLRIVARKLREHRTVGKELLGGQPAQPMGRRRQSPRYVPQAPAPKPRKLGSVVADDDDNPLNLPL